MTKKTTKKKEVTYKSVMDFKKKCFPKSTKIDKPTFLSQSTNQDYSSEERLNTFTTIFEQAFS